MPIIARSTIDEVRSRASLVEVVGEHVALKRAGSNFLGLCPFHAERSPSFNIRQSAERYHCFGCGASGDVIGFEMAMRGFSFVEAVEELASRFGIALTYESGTKRTPGAGDQRALFYGLNARAQEFFQSELARAPDEVRLYLEKRGLQAKILTEFGVGFAPRYRSAFLDFVRPQASKSGWTDEVLMRSGLMRRSARGEAYDGFRARITFPIWIDRKHIAGFGARVVPALLEPEALKMAPKYLNSPESPAYQKSSVLFGLPQAFRALRTSKCVYVVEGYLDVLGLHQAGVENVVATCGTALTEEHVRRLKNLVPKVIIMFDGDDAGRAAAGKLFPLFLHAGIDVEAAFLPDGEDPDDLALRMKEGTTEALQSLPKVSLLDCHIDNQVRAFGAQNGALLGAAAKGKIAEQFSTLLSSVTNSIEQSEYLERIAFRLDIQVADLRGFMSGKRAIQPAAPQHAEEKATPSAFRAVPELPRLEQVLLAAIMGTRGALGERVLRDVELSSLLSPESLSFIQALQEILVRNETAEDQKAGVQKLLEEFGLSWTAHWRHAHTMAREPDVDFERTILECTNAARRQKLTQLLAELDEQLRATTDGLSRMGLLQNRVGLLKLLKEPAAPRLPQAA